MSEKEDLIKFIKLLRKLGLTFKQISEEMYNIASPETISDWVKNKSIPSEDALRNYRTFKDRYDELFNNFTFILKAEKDRLRLKDGKYEGFYTYEDGRYDTYKEVINGFANTIEELIILTEKCYKRFEKINKRIKYENFYCGVFLYVELEDKGVVERSFPTRYNLFLEDAYTRFFEIFDEKVTQGYTNSWVVTEFWIAGRKKII